MKAFVIPASIFVATDWQASPACNVGPVPIHSGPHAGSYAVNTAIFDSDPAFESFRALLESLPVADLAPVDLTEPETL